MIVTAILVRLASFWGVAALLMLALWLYARRVKNWAWVDVGWSFSFALAIALWSTFYLPTHAAPLAVMVTVWSVRLGTHLLRDRVLGRPEEGRYVALRRTWGAGGFFVFYQAQALLAAVLAVAFVVPFSVLPPDLPALRWVGVGLFAVGITLETVADVQLAHWKRDPAHRGQVCEVGLWRYSRHPNYFGEWLIWVSYLAYSLAYPGGWLATIGPAIILASLFKVTGIPATEAQALRSRGDAYRRYQQTTSAFVPWPRRALPDDVT
ncbi:MAG TPA: DUF1295 domain-containing protein [Kofleriaceae bacterium]|nr:DUF1295 domain-containing protein [Kofleriaceae bacterium]